MRALEAASVSLRDLDLLAVAAGPGSFTGLRVGIAAMQGLAMALDRRIVPVSILDALAHLGADGHQLIATWVDAQRGEVFSALYDATAAHSEEGGYINFMSGDDQDRIKANYRGNYDRLTDVKRKSDADNLFHQNQNIKP